jgi:hypothetical protein
MNIQQLSTPEQARNNAVLSSYLAISKVTKQIIASIPQDILRFIVELDCKAYPNLSPKIHELVSPMLYLCLREANGLYVIHFGVDTNTEFAVHTNNFIRSIYKLTMAQYTSVNIESCIQNDSIITDTCGLFDEMQHKRPSYPYRAIKYKSLDGKRKLDTVAESNYTNA